MAITPENYDVTNPDEVQGQIDPFNHPVPGESLTNEGGARPYESPPETNEPEVVLNSIISFFKDPEQKDILLSALAAGMPVEAIVQTFMLAGVSDGRFSPDVAELIKPAVAIHIIQMALAENIPVQVFTDEVVSAEEREDDLKVKTMESMAETRPEYLQAIRGKQRMDRVQERLGEAKNRVSARERISKIEKDIPVESDGSFIDMGEG